MPQLYNDNISIILRGPPDNNGQPQPDVRVEVDLSGDIVDPPPTPLSGNNNASNL